tara:strand:+ start:4458 stop:4652 length:195 start_codon:yes stop_codon:yes gene_type:complete
MLYSYLYPEFYNEKNTCIDSIIPKLEKKIKELEDILKNKASIDIKNEIICKKIILQSIKYYYSL